MAALGIGRAVIIGTSRGGIIAMLMGVARPAMLAGVVLNDIGPAIEPIGLARIKTYVGRTPLPDDWPDAVRILKRLHGARFPGLDDEQWLAFARMTYREENGRPVSDYDPALGRTFDGVEFDEPVPTLWNEFRSLSHCPVLAIRGANSDLLSTANVARMAEMHPRFESVTVPGEGHPPLLRGAPLLQRISAFITAAEGAGPPAEAIVPRPFPVFDLDAPKAENAAGARNQS
jgi:pimeloyl-ACP methyl ester carboxylesterase